MMSATAIHQLHIRHATHSDLPRLQTLVAESMRRLAGRDYAPDQIESAIRYLMGVDPQLVDDRTYFVAAAGGDIIASGGWSKRAAHYGRGDADGHPRGDLLKPGRDAARLRALFVHPDWARQGLGRALVRLAENDTRRHGFHIMELVATRTGEPLYAQLGYRPLRTFDIVLPDGVPFQGIEMRKRLAPATGAARTAHRLATSTGMYPVAR